MTASSAVAYFGGVDVETLGCAWQPAIATVAVTLAAYSILLIETVPKILAINDAVVTPNGSHAISRAYVSSRQSVALNSA
jgi:hypothetical protein